MWRPCSSGNDAFIGELIAGGRPWTCRTPWAAQIDRGDHLVPQFIGELNAEALDRVRCADGVLSIETGNSLELPWSAGGHADRPRLHLPSSSPTRRAHALRRWLVHTQRPAIDELPRVLMLWLCLPWL